jgi:hypothetical protein
VLYEVCFVLYEPPVIGPGPRTCRFFNPCWYLQTFLIFYLATSDKVYQLVAHCQWFSLDTPASSTTITNPHDIAEILLL